MEDDRDGLLLLTMVKKEERNEKSRETESNIFYEGVELNTTSSISWDLCRHIFLTRLIPSNMLMNPSTIITTLLIDNLVLRATIRNCSDRSALP